MASRGPKRNREYRKLEASVRSRAASEMNPDVRLSFENLAKCYATLAEQTEPDSTVVETRNDFGEENWS
jgi:hypothetical protein